MKKFVIALMLAVSSMAMVVADAEAKRMGGGGSFGRQSQGVTRQAPSQSQQPPGQSQQAAPATAPGAAGAATAPRPASPWRGILGGALLGLGLGALLSHLGIGGAMAGMISTILMIALLALAALFIYRMIVRRKNGTTQAQPAFAGGYAGRSSTPEIGSRLEPQARPAALNAENVAAAGVATGAAGAATAAPWGVPPDFDVPAFLRNAKTYFIRLQDAWDRGDVNDIREFTTPEMFGELRLQLQERGASPNRTDVVSLNAELLGVEQVGNEYVASVKFSGMIKESENEPPHPFTEVWNLEKPVSGQGGWVLAGIQQLS